MDGDDERAQTSSRSAAGMQRSRNVDVGWRIGRDLEAEASKPRSLEEQERLVAARREGDATTQKALQMLEECKAMREFDRTPCLPGFWTPGLHDRVIECLDRIDNLCKDAKDLLKRGNALDRLDALQEVQDGSVEARRVAQLTKKGEEKLIDTLRLLKEGCRAGWPWGKESFDGSAAVIAEARAHFGQAGLTGFEPESGRMQFKEAMLRRVETAVNSNQRESQKRRVPVQKLLDQFKSSIEAQRFASIKTLGDIGRLPVPMDVLYNGQCVPIMEDAAWAQGQEGLGDTGVVETVCKGLRDVEPKVRVIAVDSLVKVLSRDDPRSLSELKERSSDPNIYVKREIIKTLRTFLPNNHAANNMVSFLGDLDYQTRLAAMEALPRGDDGDDADADAIIGKVLAYLSHKRREELYPSWTTEERDVVLAALQTLERIAPKGHKEVTRKVLGLLANSHSIAMRDFTGFARDVEKPLVGTPDDHGFRRGPVSIKRQLDALALEPEAVNPCRCGVSAEHIRVACIKVLEKIAVTCEDIRVAREEAEREVGQVQGASAVGSRSSSASAESGPVADAFAKQSKGADGPMASSLGMVGGAGGGRGATGGSSSTRGGSGSSKAYSDLMLHHSVLEGLCGALSDYSREVRWLASSTLGRIADADETIVVQAVASLLSHQFEDIRSLGVEMIKGVSHGKVVSPFCREMLEETVALLASSVQETRAAAASALQALCPQGEAAGQGAPGGHELVYDVVAVLADLMGDPRSTVRLAAMSAISKIVPGGGREAAVAIEDLLQHSDPRIKILAIFALEEVVGVDDEQAMYINAVAALDPSPDVRVAVMHAVSSMSTRGSVGALNALSSGCTDPSDSVRRESVSGMTRVSHKGDGRAVSVALQLLGDPSTAVRKASIETLGAVAEKGDENVCLSIFACIQGEASPDIRLVGHAAVASLRQMPWSTERVVQFSGGQSSHSTAFWWSRPPSGLRVGGQFRMPGGIPLTDSAASRLTRPANRSESLDGTLVDPPVFETAPTSKVLDTRFDVRPKTGDFATSSMAGRPQSGMSRPGTAQSGGSELSRVLFGPELIVDTDGGYEHLFGLVLLLLAGFEPALLTTVHGAAEAMDGAVSVRRLLGTFGLPSIPVVPSNPEKGVGRFDARPGTAPRRGPSTTRRVPSRFGPDYRKHLKLLPDLLSLSPLGLSLDDLLQGPGILERIEAIKKGILKGYAGALPRREVHALEDGLVRIEGMLKGLDEQARKDVTRAGGALNKPLTREELVEWSSSSSSSSSSPSFPSEKDEKGREHSPSPSSSSQAKSSGAGAGDGSSRATSVQYLAVEDDGITSVADSSDRLMEGVDSAVAALLGSLSALENSSVTLLCLGSLTTIAGALETDAEMMRNKVRGMVIMGGSLYGAKAASEDSAYHTQGGAEFNFYYHPQAVYDVLHSGLDVTLVGLDVANAEAVSKDDILYLAHETEGESLGSRVLRRMLQTFDLSPAYAAVACFYVAKPEAFRTEKKWIEVNPQSGVVCEALPGKQGAVLVRCALEVNRDVYFEHLAKVMNMDDEYSDDDEEEEEE